MFKKCKICKEHYYIELSKILNDYSQPSEMPEKLYQKAAVAESHILVLEKKIKFLKHRFKKKKGFLV